MFFYFVSFLHNFGVTGFTKNLIRENNRTLMRRLFVLIVSAQFFLAGKSQISVGLKAGVGIADQDQKVSDYHFNPASKIGCNLGVTLERSLSQIFLVSTGLNYVVKGSKIGFRITNGAISPSNPGIPTKINSTLHYFEIPVDFAGKIILSSKSRATVGTGPYIAFGITGRNRLEYDGSITKPFEESLYERFDFGGNIFASYQIGKIEISICYDHGFIDITGHDEFYVLKNRYAGLNLCYYLRKN